jgi:hypothetical protein
MVQLPRCSIHVESPNKISPAVGRHRLLYRRSSNVLNYMRDQTAPLVIIVQFSDLHQGSKPALKFFPFPHLGCPGVGEAFLVNVYLYRSGMDLVGAVGSEPWLCTHHPHGGVEVTIEVHQRTFENPLYNFLMEVVDVGNGPHLPFVHCLLV